MEDDFNEEQQILQTLCEELANKRYGKLVTSVEVSLDGFDALEQLKVALGVKGLCVTHYYLKPTLYGITGQTAVIDESVSVEVFEAIEQFFKKNLPTPEEIIEKVLQELNKTHDYETDEEGFVALKDHTPPLNSRCIVKLHENKARASAFFEKNFYTEIAMHPDNQYRPKAGFYYRTVSNHLASIIETPLHHVTGWKLQPFTIEDFKNLLSEE